MTVCRADIRLTLDDGTDLAARINPRLVELTLTEKRGEDADELSITLHNHDGALATPATGKTLSLAIGWASGAGVVTGMVGKGRYTVDEIEESGPPDILTIRARSADLPGEYSRRRTQSWRDTTVGAILSTIAGRNGGTARVHADLSGIAVTAIEQNGRSDAAFVRDMGRRYDAVSTWKNGMLLFMPAGAATTPGGAAIPAITLTRQDGWTWRCSRAERDNVGGAEAQWHDPATGRRHTVRVGDGNRHRLRTVYASEGEARRAAQSEADRRRRGAMTFEYDLARADMAIVPNGKITLSGWTTAIDGEGWTVETVETSYNASGLTQRITLERA